MSSSPSWPCSLSRARSRWRSAARRAPAAGRGAWWRHGRRRPARSGPAAARQSDRIELVGATTASSSPASRAPCGSNMAPVTAAWSKAPGVRRCRASTRANQGRVSPMRTSLSPSLKGPSAPTRASAAMRRKAPAGKAWPAQATATGAGKERMRSASVAPSRSRATTSSAARRGPRGRTRPRNSPAARSAGRLFRLVSAWSKASCRARSIGMEKTFTLPSSMEMVLMWSFRW